jgi:hypothetical protein
MHSSTLPSDGDPHIPCGRMTSVHGANALMPLHACLRHGHPLLRPCQQSSCWSLSQGAHIESRVLLPRLASLMAARMSEAATCIMQQQSTPTNRRLSLPECMHGMHVTVASLCLGSSLLRSHPLSQADDLFHREPTASHGCLYLVHWPLWLHDCPRQPQPSLLQHAKPIPTHSP